MLDPQFTAQLMQLLSMPQAQCDLALNLFHKEKAKEMAQYTRLMVRPDARAVYIKLQELFPNAPEFEANSDPDFMFVEMFKHMVADAFNILYVSPKSPSPIILTGTNNA